VCIYFFCGPCILLLFFHFSGVKRQRAAVLRYAYIACLVRFIP